MAYQQLTLEERTMIYAFCKVEYSITEISNELGRHKSTISREISRNTGCRGYRPKQADERAQERRQTAYKAIKWDSDVEDEITKHLKNRWSLEQVSEWLKAYQ